MNVSLSLSGSASSPCAYDLIGWEQHMDQLYTYFYLLIFIPGLLLNTTALWVLCKHISKKTKAVIFMINLVVADLAHVFSLPLRIYYYLTHAWPFGRPLCLLCFYLKYLNMYAAIFFLVCISVQRCVFLLKPFCARVWRRRYDLLISAAVWLVVGVGCSPFIIMRSAGGPKAGLHHVPYANVTSGALASPGADPPAPTVDDPPGAGCFKDLPIRRLPLPLLVGVMSAAELFGFLLPLSAIGCSSCLIARSLGRKRAGERTDAAPAATSGPALFWTRSWSRSSTERPARERRASGGGGGGGGGGGAPSDGEKHRALRMVLSCSALFLVCFVPYHLNFLLYMMVSQDLVSHCATQLAVRRFHPVSLCLASVSCCLNPLLYFFITAEFRMHLHSHTSSLSSYVFSSPKCSSGRQELLDRGRLMSVESASSCSVAPPRDVLALMERRTSSNRDYASSSCFSTFSQGAFNKQLEHT